MFNLPVSCCFEHRGSPKVRSLCFFCVITLMFQYEIFRLSQNSFAIVQCEYIVKERTHLYTLRKREKSKLRATKEVDWLFLFYFFICICIYKYIYCLFILFSCSAEGESCGCRGIIVITNSACCALFFEFDRRSRPGAPSRHAPHCRRRSGLQNHS